MKNMRKIPGVLVLSLIAAAAITGCDNKPPFARLMTAVDSVNTYYQHQPDIGLPTPGSYTTR